MVTHHPLLFKPPKSFVEFSYTTNLTSEMIRRGMSLIAAHTNYDSIAEGTNGELADRLGLSKEGRKFLKPAPLHATEVKYAVFVPVDYVSQVLEAIAQAGAGVIGDYSHCTFRSPGTGTFKPLDGANPHTGEVGKLEEATNEVRLECICPKSRLSRLIERVAKVHPYEEVAFDVYTLEPRQEATAGLGLIGDLVAPTTLGDLARRAREQIGSHRPGIVGDPETMIRRVALCSGGAGQFVHSWRTGTADLYVTGEMNHHDCIEARHRGIPVLLVGHQESEAIAMPRFARQIEEQLNGLGFTNCQIHAEESVEPLVLGI